MIFELTDHQRHRYSRSILLSEMGEEGQIKLLNASVLVIGTGALGSIASMYLAAAGIGRIGICDFDTIDISNLQRQLSFTEGDVGKNKVDVAAVKLRQINSEIEIDVYSERLTHERAREIFAKYDIIVEASDNPPTKYIVTDVAYELGKPCVLGGVAQIRGQVMTIPPGCTSYRDLFPDAAAEGEYKPCSVAGVMGSVPGIVASIQVAEIIKLIISETIPDSSMLLSFNAMTMDFMKMNM